jgi:hypothetical protein
MMPGGTFGIRHYELGMVALQHSYEVSVASQVITVVTMPTIKAEVESAMTNPL